MGDWSWHRLLNMSWARRTICPDGNETSWFWMTFLLTFISIIRLLIDILSVGVCLNWCKLEHLKTILNSVQANRECLSCYDGLWFRLRQLEISDCAILFGFANHPNKWFCTLITISKQRSTNAVLNSYCCGILDKAYTIILDGVLDQ